MSSKLPYALPPMPTDKKRVVFSFGLSDLEFFKCFPSDDYLGTRYDKNPCQLVIVWDALLKPYNCEMQIYNFRNQLLLSIPIPKNINVPYTIVDGMINEWISKEEFVFFQFVFTKGSDFVKSTIPIKMHFSPANKPDYLKLIKPMDFDRFKVLYDNAVCNADLRYDESNGWVYDFFTNDGTLAFSLAWIPSGVVQVTDQNLFPNEKMVARANINVPSTFVLDLNESDGTNVVKRLTDYVNSVEDATFDVWKYNGDGSFTEVIPLSKSYDSTSIKIELSNVVNGKIRVSCKSKRFEPDGDSVLIGSVYSGNALMSENDEYLFTNQELKE